MCSTVISIGNHRTAQHFKKCHLCISCYTSICFNRNFCRGSQAGQHASVCDTFFWPVWQITSASNRNQSAGIAKLANGAGLKILYLVFRGFESPSLHSFSFRAILPYRNRVRQQYFARNAALVHFFLFPQNSNIILIEKLFGILVPKGVLQPF